MLAVSFKKFNNISTKIVFYYGFRWLKINVSVLIMSITKFSISASLRNRQNTYWTIRFILLVSAKHQSTISDRIQKTMEI